MLKKGNIVLAFALILLLASCNRQPEKPKEVVIFLPYSSMTQIYKSAHKAALEEFSDKEKYHLSVLPLTEENEDLFNDKSYCPDASQRLEWQLQKVLDSLITPDLIILHGDRSAYGAAFLDSPTIRNTPLLSTGVVYPRYNNILTQMPNMVVMESRPEVKKNIDFIADLGFSTHIITELDSTFIDDHIREEITQEFANLGDKYRTNLYLEQEDRFLSKEKRDSRPTLFPISISDTLKNNHHPDVPAPFSIKWVFNTQMESTTYLHLKDDIFSNTVMNFNVGLYLAMTPEYFNLPLINSLNSCLGGYMTPFPSMWKQVHPIVDQLLNGTPPKQIPWGTLQKDYWLDWRLAKNIHDFANEFPKGVNFVNLPWNHRSKALIYSVYILFALLGLSLLIYVIIIPAIMLSKDRKQLDRLLVEAQAAKESNNNVNSIMTQLNSYVWYMYPDQRFEFSDAFYWDFNISRDRRIDFESIAKIVHEPGRSKLREMLFSNDDKISDEMEILVDLPGYEKPRAIQMHAIRLSNKVADNEDVLQIKAGFFYFNDESYWLNNELRQAYRRSEELMEKESFLTTMNDEFRKPVEKISFYSHLIAEQYHTMTEKQKEDCLAKVLDSNSRIVDLLNEIMQGVEHDSESGKTRLTKLQVEDLMEEVYAKFSAVTDKRYEIHLWPGPKNSSIEAFRPELLLVINTLISNSLQFDSTTEKEKADSTDIEVKRIDMGWTESQDEEVIIFIDNINDDIYNFKDIIGSIGGHIEVFHFPGKPTRIELTFRRLHRGGAKMEIRI